MPVRKEGKIELEPLLAQEPHMPVRKQDTSGLGMYMEHCTRCMGHNKEHCTGNKEDSTGNKAVPDKACKVNYRYSCCTDNNRRRGNDMLQPSISLALDLVSESQFCWMDLNRGIARPVDIPKKSSLGSSRLFSDLSYGKRSL